ncbi:MAG: hypothetical protein F6J87_11675 [Spirulina sp. SIO3F2]|nr:hypothetical protein [Spirulina sp. SIO3F2]
MNQYIRIKRAILLLIVSIATSIGLFVGGAFHPQTAKAAVDDSTCQFMAALISGMPEDKLALPRFFVFDSLMFATGECPSLYKAYIERSVRENFLPPEALNF